MTADNIEGKNFYSSTQFNAIREGILMRVQSVREGQHGSLSVNLHNDMDSRKKEGAPSIYSAITCI